MNCPSLLKEISDLLWPTCAHGFRTIPGGPVPITNRADALPSTTGNCSNKDEPGAGKLNIEGAMHAGGPVPRDSWSNTAIASPRLSSSNSLTHHTTVDGYTVSWVHGRALDYYYDGSVFLGLGVLIGDGVLMSPEVIN